MQQGAHAIFGPSDPHLGAHVQSICDALEIPHLEVNSYSHFINSSCIIKECLSKPNFVCSTFLWKIQKARLDMDSEYKPYSINVYPPIDVINKAFMDVMFFLNWTKVAIIYEEDQGRWIINFPALVIGIIV